MHHYAFLDTPTFTEKLLILRRWMVLKKTLVVLNL